jgi:hypothetical protein
MRSASLVATVALAVLLAPSAASACTIAGPLDPSEQLDRADVAVYGKVVSRKLLRASKPPVSGADYRYRFRVLKTYKGRVARTITLLGGTEESLCEAGLLDVGDRFGLLLRGRSPFKISLTSFITKADLERAKRPRG